MSAEHTTPDMSDSQRDKSRPQPLHVSRSFTRMDASPTELSPRKRTNTLQESGIPPIPEARSIVGHADRDGRPHEVDVFEYQDNDNENRDNEEDSTPQLKLPSTFDELPAEVRTLTEKFLEHLSAKVHPTPLSADRLSELFQDFYLRAAAQIDLHIASLARRMGRDGGNPQSSGVRQAKQRSRANSRTNKNNAAGGEMLTAVEVSERRKARRLLELRRVALENAVERVICEKVYDRIWKHRSTEDDARDEKLRSRTAALSLIGIGLKELHMDADPAKEQVRQLSQDNEDAIFDSLAPARQALQRMDQEHFPQGKLQHLAAAHKSIVETLSQIFPSSSSADEILPTLIYTLITSPAEGINVVSNLQFIQRFRSASKIDGEAAYCLVNLEAAISFLETVDLTSLRSDINPQQTASVGDATTGGGPILTATDTSTIQAEPAQAAPKVATTEVVIEGATSGPTQDAAGSLKAATSGRPPLHQRRISELMQAQADRIEAGRENLLSAADRVYDSINGTLENSLQFVFGRFKDQATGRSILPKTLEEARRLVNPPPPEDEEALGTSRSSSPASEDPLLMARKSDSKMMDLISGRKSIRERSADSSRSRESSKPGPHSQDTGSRDKAREEPMNTASNLFSQINQINPLNRFAVPGFARFGRSTSVSTTQPSTPPDRNGQKLAGVQEAPNKSGSIVETTKENSHVASGDDGERMNALEALAELRKLRPPKKRFLEVSSANELKLGEVEELLLEYRRLAKAIGEAIAQ